MALIPLTMVVVFTAIKQGYEDILRHRTDAQVNKAPVRVLRNGVFSIIQRKDIKVSFESHFLGQIINDYICYQVR